MCEIVLVLAFTIIFKRVIQEKCKVKMLPWQQFLSELAESYRQVMLDLHEGIRNV